jgi:hypothetical protein
MSSFSDFEDRLDADVYGEDDQKEQEQEKEEEEQEDKNDESSD